MDGAVAVMTGVSPENGVAGGVSGIVPPGVICKNFEASPTNTLIAVGVNV